MNHEVYMRRCFELAKNGMGYTTPNPLVGSVIVCGSEIIGEGWHHKAGTAHAEVNAIKDVRDSDLLAKSRLYVNLEPCSHYGRTPPCADLIIESKIPRVVISNLDPHKAVAGKGIERLRNAGVEVVTSVLEPEGAHLNRRFFCFHKKKRPYIILKWAQSEDGFLDKTREKDTVGVNWITQAETQSLVHKWRSEEDAILIGGNTLLNDNPSLTTRAYTGKNAIPLVWSSQDHHDSKLNLSQKESTIFLNQLIDSDEEKSRINVHRVVQKLADRNILSVLVEGGAATLKSFLEAGLWDEARVITGNKTFKEGLKAPVIKAKPGKEMRFSSDVIHYYFK